MAVGLARYMVSALRLHQAELNRHAVHFSATAQAMAVWLLLLGGIWIYRLKKYSKIAYGAAQIIAAFVTNAALIAKLDRSELSSFSVSDTTIIAIGAFTLLLSKGAGDTGSMEMRGLELCGFRHPTGVRRRPGLVAAAVVIDVTRRLALGFGAHLNRVLRFG